MKYLHTMVRVSDLERSLDFYCKKLGLKELKRMENEKGRFTLVFLAAPGDEETQAVLPTLPQEIEQLWVQVLSAPIQFVDRCLVQAEHRLE